MDKQKTIEILATLASGVDPVSGEVLPPDSPYQNVDVTRALFHALDVLKNVRPKRGQFANQGSKWTPEEEEQLKKLFSEGWKVAELAKKHQRTSGAIRSRLVKLGLIT